MPRGSINMERQLSALTQQVGQHGILLKDIGSKVDRLTEAMERLAKIEQQIINATGTNTKLVLDVDQLWAHSRKRDIEDAKLEARVVALEKEDARDGGRWEKVLTWAGPIIAALALSGALAWVAKNVGG